MGFLKHVVFPLLILMYANNAVQFLVLQNGRELLEDSGWPKTGPVLTPWEERLLTMIGNGGLGALFGSVVGIFTEHGHYRAVFATTQLITFVAEAYTCYRTGFPWKFLAGMATLLAVGLISHAFEPGFLTKDKSKSKQK